MAAAAAGLRAHWGRPEAHVRRPASVPAAAHSLVADLQAFAGASRAAARREGLERAVRLGLCPIVTSQYSSTTLSQISDHIQSLIS